MKGGSMAGAKDYIYYKEYRTAGQPFSMGTRTYFTAEEVMQAYAEEVNRPWQAVEKRETAEQYMKRMNIWRVPENSIYTAEIEQLLKHQ